MTSYGIFNLKLKLKVKVLSIKFRADLITVYIVHSHKKCFPKYIYEFNKPHIIYIYITLT